MAGNHGGYKAPCPACGHNMRVRTSDVEETDGKAVWRSIYGQCQSMVCGATYTGRLTTQYTLQPSSLPSPRTRLPMAPSLARQRPAPQPSEFDVLAERVAACRAKGMTRRETLIETGCTPIQLRKIWPERVAPVRRKIEACRAAGMTRDDARRLVKCDRKTFSAYWPAVPCVDTRHA